MWPAKPFLNNETVVDILFLLLYCLPSGNGVANSLALEAGVLVLMHHNPTEILTRQNVLPS
jgi:hypothetical protein